jgi:hypothetical protein
MTTTKKMLLGLAFVVLMAGTVRTPAQAADVICYNCPPQWADWAPICPAPNHAVAFDLNNQCPPSFKIEPPGFHLHAWFSNKTYGDIVTHFVPIGEFDGPHPFFRQNDQLL